MRKISQIIALAAIAVFSVSCVENSSQYKNLLAERDSLVSKNSVIEAGYNELFETLNEVEAGFQEIRAGEKKINVTMPGIENQSKSRKAQIVAELNEIKALVQKNKEKIAYLQGQLNKQVRDNKAMSQLVARLQAELDEKTATIASLQKELEAKNLKIEELNTTVGSLNQNVAQLNETSAKQQATISSQDEAINSVWYIVATSKELKDAKVVTSNGLFASKSIMKKDADLSVFTKVDRRKLTSLELKDNKVKILSSHPEGSYTLTPGEDKMLTLNISNPEKFWSVSKYLIIQK